MDWKVTRRDTTAGSFSVVGGWEHFRPKFIGHPGSLAEGLDLVANDDAVLLLPRFVRHRGRRRVTMRPVAEREATWDIVVAWQPGRRTGVLQALLDGFAAEGAKDRKRHDAANELV